MNPRISNMLKYISTPRGLATVTGATILAAATNANVMATGGYFTSHAALVIALSIGVFAGARVIGSGEAGKIAAVIIIALFSGELYNFSATGERIVVERENGAAPLKDALAKHNAALAKLHDLEGGTIASARLTLATTAEAKAKAAYEKELREGGRCKSICNGLKAEADKASVEVADAAQEAQKLHAAAIEAAKAEVEANPLPASATPLADRLGWAPWVLDLVMAGLLSVGANGLAGTLIAYGAHSTVSKSEIVAQHNDNEQTDFSVSEFEAAKVRAMVSGSQPDPTPPKPRKRRKSDQFPANVVDFRDHPVVKALKDNGGSVSSNQQLAKLMGVCEAESTKRVQEVQNRLTVSRVGKEKRIALKA
jgi:hypothetical protein